jgi:hypothetical protein
MRKGKDPDRIRTADYWIRIREAQKHADPDPVPDPDPQHWLSQTGGQVGRGEDSKLLNGTDIVYNAAGTARGP